MEAAFSHAAALNSCLSVPGDKSISHRAAIIAALAVGKSGIRNFSGAADCASTLEVLRALGVAIEADADGITVEGRGSLQNPALPLDCGNSGTTMRLVAGAVASYPLKVVLTGDDSLLARPMKRITEPLALMGADIAASDEAGHPPLKVSGGDLEAITYAPPVASAQVKSAILLAGLRADGVTTVQESAATRDHTERLLGLAGIEVSSRGLSVSVVPGVPAPLDMAVPGDFSSAAFFIAAALMVPGSSIKVNGVGLNPTRTHFLRLLERMGASVDASPQVADDAAEPAGEVTARYGPLQAIEISSGDVAQAIDEVTLLALLATAARGSTVIRGAGELRHKESDRIRSTVAALQALGAHIEETEDGMAVEGPVQLRGARVASGGDHRIAMMLAVAGLAAEGETVVDGWEWTQISFPGFDVALRELGEE